MNFVTRRLLAYGSPETAAMVHEHLGGKNYYCSGTGLTGAGWVPGGMHLRELSTYRVDVNYPEVDLDAGEPVFGFRVSVPIARPEIGRSWPILAKNISTGELYFADEHSLFQLLRGEGGRAGFETRTFKWTFVPGVGQEPITLELTAQVLDGLGKGNWWAAAAIMRRTTHFDWGVETHPQGNEFWRRLGLHPAADGMYYKIAGGVCRAKYARTDLEKVEGLQAAAPANVRVLTPTLYLQGWDDDNYEAIGLFAFAGEEVEYETRLDDQAEIVRALGGEWHDIASRLEAGARGKWEADRQYRLQQVALATEAEEQERQLQALLEAQGDRDVSLEDSVRAGNCRPGSARFRDQFFPGRDSVRVRELVPHLSNAAVRRLLLSVLLPKEN